MPNAFHRRPGGTNGFVLSLVLLGLVVLVALGAYFIHVEDQDAARQPAPKTATVQDRTVRLDRTFDAEAGVVCWTARDGSSQQVVALSCLPVGQTQLVELWPEYRHIQAQEGLQP